MKFVPVFHLKVCLPAERRELRAEICGLPVRGPYGLILLTQIMMVHPSEAQAPVSSPWREILRVGGWGWFGRRERHCGAPVARRPAAPPCTSAESDLEDIRVVALFGRADAWGFNRFPAEHARVPPEGGVAPGGAYWVANEIPLGRRGVAKSLGVKLSISSRAGT